MNSPVADAPPTGDRYSRHRTIAGFSQEALQRSRFLVIGAGAIGNEVVKNLCLLGVGQIEVFDLDHVEIHNLTRSVLLRETDLGRPKAEALVEHARRLDPAVRLTAVVGDIRDTLAPSRVRDADVVIGALDNFEARLWVNRLCHDLGRRWINAAIDHRHASVEAFAFDTGGEPACYECGLPDSVHARIAERYSCGGLMRAALAEKIMPTTAITASLAGALAVEQALRPPPTSRRLLFDSQAGYSSTARLALRSDCPGCAGQRPGRLQVVQRPGLSLRGLADWARAAAPGDTIALAEALVWSARCNQCGDTEATRALPGQPARRVGETATFCFRCGAEAIAIELRDLADPDELAALAGQIGDRALPLAFARVGPYLVDARPMPAQMPGHHVDTPGPLAPI